jgi:hypothetical protein
MDERILPCLEFDMTLGGRYHGIARHVQRTAVGVSCSSYTRM